MSVSHGRFGLHASRRLLCGPPSPPHFTLTLECRLLPTPTSHHEALCASRLLSGAPSPQQRCHPPRPSTPVRWVLRHPPVGHTARLPALCWTRPTPKGGCRLLGGRVPPPLPGVPSPASSAFSAVSTEGLFVELISINSVFH